MAILVQSNKKPSVTFPSQTGNLVTFNAQYAGLPLKSHTVALTATQSGSGTPSPDNVRTINGYSAINIANASEDLYHDITIGNGYLDIYGNVQASGVSSVTDYIPVVEGLVYYYYDYATASLGPRNICIYDDSKQFVSYLAYETANKKAYFSIPSTGAYIRITIDRNYTNQHLYNGTTTTIQIGSTVYGGEYDARTGLLTITHGYIASYNGEAINEPWISSMDEYVEGTTPTNGAQVVYPLATPQTIQLPPCPIDTLEGVNNIWADTGDTTASYIKIGG